MPELLLIDLTVNQILLLQKVVEERIKATTNETELFYLISIRIKLLEQVPF